MKNLRIILLIAFLFSGEASAQVQRDSLQSKEIEAIILSMKRLELGVVSSQKLSGKELQNMNSLSVADAVRYFSGLQLKDYGGIGGMKTVNIRGMGTQHVGVFYDGVPLGNAQNGTVDLGRFSLENVESISLYNGQKSEIFQSAKDFGASGSIYIQSKSPSFKTNKNTNVGIQYKSGSFGLVNPSAHIEQKISNQLALNLNYEALFADGEYKFYQRVALPDGRLGWERKGTRTDGDVKAQRAEAGLYGKLNKGEWRLKSYFYSSERGVPGAITKNTQVFSTRQWDRNFFVQGSLDKEISTNYKFAFKAKFANDYLHFYDNNPLGTPLLIDNKYTQKEVYLSTSHLYKVAPYLSFSVSADYQYNTLDANLRQFAFPERHTGLVSFASQLEKGKFKLQASVLGTFVQEKVENKIFAVPKDFKEWTPSAFISYKPFNRIDFKLHGFYKRMFRMPTFNDLYYTEVGSSLLKPEYTHQYDLGFTFNKDFKTSRLQNINLIVDAYYNQVTDKIIAYPKGQQFRWTMLNLGEVEAKGIDVSIQSIWLLFGDFLLNNRFTYSFEEALDVTKSKIDSYYRNQIPYIPRHSGSALFGINYKKWQLNYSFLYTGERYNMSANIPSNYEQPWYTSDISVSKNVWLGHFDTRLSLEVNNLMNQNYSVIRNYPMPGINYRVGLKVNF